MMNKKLLTAAAVLLLSSCANQAGNDTAVYESLETISGAVSSSEAAEKISETTSVSETGTKASETTTVSETKTESSETTSVSATEVQIPEFSVSDEELLALAYADYSSADYISDYTVLDNMGHIPAEYESCDVILVPVSENIEEYAADEKNYPEFYEEGTAGDGVIRKIGENDLYSQWVNEYTEIRTYYSNDILTEKRIARAYRRVYLKNIRLKGNERVYAGDFTEKDIKAVFDILYMDAPMVSREVYERDGTFVYSFYYTVISYGDFGLNDEISLRREDIEILSGGTIKSVGDFIVKRCEIPNTASSPEGFE